MRRYVLFIMMLLGTFSSIFAQDDSGQVLIFRNTGEINLLFASEIDSIVCSSVKTENSNDEVVPSQLFYTKDTTLVVPVSEIDSVAFGSRNAIEPKANVRMMASEDSLWITGYDGDYVYYKGNTPDNILPKIDEKLFYGQCDDLFPVGLVAKVLDVQKNGEAYSVKVENVELDQLFDRLFFSGAINDDAPITRSANTEDAYQKRILHINSNIGVTGGQIEGQNEAIFKGKVVVDGLKGYYRIDGSIKNSMDLSFTSKCEHSGHKVNSHNKNRLLTVDVGKFAKVFLPKVEYGFYYNVDADVDADLLIKRTNVVSFTFVYDKKTTEKFVINSISSIDRGTSAQSDITLNGKVNCGIYCKLDLNIVRKGLIGQLEYIGGPSLQSKFGCNMLSNLGTFDASKYNKAKVVSCMNNHAIGRCMIKDDWMQMFEYKPVLAMRSYDMFPNYFATKAIKEHHKDNTKIFFRAKSKKNLHDVTTGFELLDKKGVILEKDYVGVIKQSVDTAQIFNKDYSEKAELYYDTLYMRPIFKYRGYEIVADTIPVLDDVFMEPIVFAFSKSSMSVCSGWPYSGSQHNQDSLIYIAGPYMSIPVIENTSTKKSSVVPDIYRTSGSSDNASNSLSEDYFVPQSERIPLYINKDEDVAPLDE